MSSRRVSDVENPTEGDNAVVRKLKTIKKYLKVWWKFFTILEIVFAIFAFGIAIGALIRLNSELEKTNEIIRGLEAKLDFLRGRESGKNDLEEEIPQNKDITKVQPVTDQAKLIDQVDNQAKKIEELNDTLNKILDEIDSNLYDGIKANLSDIANEIENFQSLKSEQEIEIERIALSTSVLYNHDDFLHTVRDQQGQYNISMIAEDQQEDNVNELYRTAREVNETAEAFHKYSLSSSSNFSAILDEVKAMNMEQELNINELDVTITDMYDNWPLRSRRDCFDLLNEKIYHSGTYRITLNNKRVYVQCQIYEDGAMWTVLLRRKSGSVDFYRNWDGYRNGFGIANDEVWLGLERMHEITSSGSYTLRVNLMNWDNNKGYATYSSFRIEDESNGYKLKVSGYSGDAGNALDYHQNQEFSTKDRGIKQNCANNFNGAWWYNDCHFAQLTGLYLRGGVVNNSGICWLQWRSNFYSMKEAEMKIKRN